MKYKLQYPEVNKLILVSVDSLVDRLSKDTPEFFVSPNTKSLTSLNRIQSCVEFLKNNEVVEPPFILFENGFMGVIDGRHRIAAAKKMGYTHLYIEVPRDQKNLFNCLI